MSAPHYVYFPVDKKELDWGFYLTTCGRRDAAPRSVFPPPDHPAAYRFDPTVGRVLPEYQILWIVGGKGAFSSDATGEIELAQGSGAVLFPGVWHSYRPNLATGWRAYWIGFNGSYAFELCQNGIFSPERPIFRPSKPDALTNAFETLIEKTRRGEPSKTFKYNPLALEILTLCADEVQESEERELSGKERIVQDALRRIWGWSYRTLSVDDLAAAVGVNRRTLERYFRQTLGRSILDEIRGCRVVRAQRLLEYARIPIEQVATTVGFSSAAQMRRVFRDVLNVSPERYRNGWRRAQRVGETNANKEE